ncbi:hypothetical protein NQ117_07025 [Paenibacillus sp. SC116]|uniref:hypothetical protein n=1 Tax=Paenibacillus sp. SC116 TaxID=2968986 RepID=UPI00215B6893|nr:hypothetical protein [Paenibacillus sp. SC116]MCR8843431.1 hypothetical protein [Paenibacillus sp. SC116]
MRDFNQFNRKYVKRSIIQQYQLNLVGKLSKIFLTNDVCDEWPSMGNEYNLSIYSPRIDVAVGPFATHERLGNCYDQMIHYPRSELFFRKLVDYNRINLEMYDGFVEGSSFEEIRYLNHNARCLMAIEIENHVSRKHLMGGAINASALGRFGVVLPWTNEKLRAIVKLVRYLRYLRYAEKNTFDTTNLLIITKEQMDRAIEEALFQENLQANQ